MGCKSCKATPATSATDKVVLDDIYERFGMYIICIEWLTLKLQTRSQSQYCTIEELERLCERVMTFRIKFDQSDLEQKLKLADESREISQYITSLKGKQLY